MKFDFLQFVIYFGVFLSEQNNTCISSFYPIYATGKHNSNEMIVGFIFSFQSIGLFFSSFYAGKIMSKTPESRKSLIVWGLVL